MTVGTVYSVSCVQLQSYSLALTDAIFRRLNTLTPSFLIGLITSAFIADYRPVIVVLSAFAGGRPVCHRHLDCVCLRSAEWNSPCGAVYVT